MKQKYTVSNNNQLIITKSDQILKPSGKFTLNKSNQLTYQTLEPQDWRLGHGIPERIHLKGKWRIDKDHNLIYTLRKTPTQSGGEQLLLRTQITQAKANSLVFSLGTQGKAGTHNLHLLELKGKWGANQENKLQFLVKQLNSKPDTLTFQGTWKVSKNTLIYTYKKTHLSTKTKYTHTLRFRGFWEINKKNRLTYILDRKENSLFEFKAFLETPSLIGKKGVIKYRVGIGLKKETITLYGVWKLHRKTGLSLELDYGYNQIKAIRFSAFARINKRNKITFKLRSKEGKDLGLSVEFSRSFLENSAEWFLRVLAEDKRPRIEWGVGITF